MAQTTINNGDSGSTARAAINNNFTELYRGGANAISALTDGANIATNANNGPFFSVTLGGNRTLDNPTNLVAGRQYVWLISQDGTGSRTLAYGTNFDWGTVGTPTLSTGANKLDIISAIYDGTKLRAVINKGFN